jgi:hypothetical protein
MRLRAILNAETIIEILYWFTGHATSDLRAIASLAIQVTIEALFSDGVWVITEWAIRDAIRCTPLLLLEDHHVLHIIRSIRRALGVASTFCKIGKRVLANDAILVFSAVAEAAAVMTPNITDFNVFVPL